MEFSRQEYCSGLPFSLGELTDWGAEAGSSALQADSLTSEPLGRPTDTNRQISFRKTGTVDTPCSSIWGSCWSWRKCKKESQVAQSCPTLCETMDCSPPGSSVHGILQARILEWVAISFSRGSSRPRDQTRVSRIVGRCFYHLSHQGMLILKFHKLDKTPNPLHLHHKFDFPGPPVLFSFRFPLAVVLSSGREWPLAGRQAWWAIPLIFAPMGGSLSQPPPSKELSHFQALGWGPVLLPLSTSYPVADTYAAARLQRKDNLLFCTCCCLISIGSQWCCSQQKHRFTLRSCPFRNGIILPWCSLTGKNPFHMGTSVSIWNWF